MCLEVMSPERPTRRASSETGSGSPFANSRRSAQRAGSLSSRASFPSGTAAAVGLLMAVLRSREPSMRHPQPRPADHAPAGRGPGHARRLRGWWRRTQSPIRRLRVHATGEKFTASSSICGFTDNSPEAALAAAYRAGWRGCGIGGGWRSSSLLCGYSFCPNAEDRRVEGVEDALHRELKVPEIKPLFVKSVQS